MTVELTSALQDALQAHIAEALIGQGVAEEVDGAKPDVPVFMGVTDEEHRVYVRLEAFGMHQGNSSAGHVDRHSFLVRVVHDKGTAGDVVSRGDHQTTRVMGLINSALKDWAPLEMASQVKFLNSFEAEDKNPDITMRVSRYQTHLTGD